MSLNVRDLLVGFKITSFDSDNSTCNVTVTFTDLGKDVNDPLYVRSKNFVNVITSPLLSYRLNNPVNGFDNYLGKVYNSAIDSPDSKENPFQLLFMSVTDEASREKYGDSLMKLCLVHERHSLRVVTKDPFGGEVVEYINRYHNKKNFRRYRDLRKSNSNS